MGLPGWVTAILAGGLQALSLAWPGSGEPTAWLQVLSLAWLAHGLQRLARQSVTLRSALWAGARHGGVFATVWLAGSFWWLQVSMHRFGGLPAWAAALAVLALAAALALYYALACAVWTAWRARWFQNAAPAPAFASAMLFAALWTLAELMRGRWWTGFPWGAGGYAHVEGILQVWAPWVGVYGIGAIAASLAVWIGAAQGAPGRWRALIGVLALTAWMSLWSPSWTRSSGEQQVQLLQANIAQDDKFNQAGGIREALQWYAEQLQTATAPLVVAPETAIPLLPRHLPEGYWDALKARYAGQSAQTALVGVPLGEATRGYTNSVVALGPLGQPSYRYDKHHLVPFGEFIPPGFAWFVRQMNIPLGQFKAGPVDAAPLHWQGQMLAPNICYEDVFGEELARRFTDPQNAPTVFVNVSNIAWFGNTVAVDQHLLISRMRALEFERPMLRATNTGATAIIDHRGQVLQLLPRFTRGSLTGRYEGRTGLTPYARWAGAWGLGPLWALALGVAGWVLWRTRRLLR
jgi:apolipoprotein N-acyltransferase